VKKLNLEKVSIMEEDIHLKYLQSFLIKFLKYQSKNIDDFESENYFKYPILIKYLNFAFKRNSPNPV
jgi:hypothetical protein